MYEQFQQTSATLREARACMMHCLQGVVDLFEQGSEHTQLQRVRGLALAVGVLHGSMGQAFRATLWPHWATACEEEGTLSMVAGMPTYHAAVSLVSWQWRDSSSAGGKHCEWCQAPLRRWSAAASTRP
jgi:hypothetical protein